ncbi:MAG: DUF554 domain-containing protein [Clostridia bacterium]|nr:DUF554 domain-containing protein [Clostridia bacterium]
MLGVTVNTVAVIIGSLLGLVFKKGIPDRISDAITSILGLAVFFVGLSSAFDGHNILITIISLALGTVIGTIAGVDTGINKLGDWVENRFSKEKGKVNIAQGFVTASLLFCVGSMTIVGSLQAGISGNNEMLFTKSLLDFVMAIVLTSTLGIGVILSSLFVFVFQGTIALCAGLAAGFLSDFVIAEMTCTGAILVMAIGLNLAGITKIKVADCMPAVFLPIVICPISNLISGFVSSIM